MSTRRTRPGPARRRSVVAALTGAFLLSIIPALPVAADTTAQALPFAQDWSDTSLITTDLVWDAVPGVVGYRGDGIASTGTDPQQVTVDSNVIDVQANETNPNTFTTGGVAEFHIADPVVALQGSGTADAPSVVFNLSTTGLSDIHVAYNLRDIDGSADNAFQQVALQYRVGSSGNFTNVPAGYVADATTGPSAATLVTPVSVTLPAAANDQAVIGIRVITTDATGSDEWVGVDDIAVTGTPIEGDSPPAVEATTPAQDATDVAVDAGIDIAFDEAVDVADPWFTIACTLSGAHSAVVSGIGASRSLNPDDDFTPGEICTVTILAGQVSDQDADDPPDVMLADYEFSFTTASPVVVPSLVINEIDYDQPGADGAEFLEIKNTAASAVSLGGVSIVYVNGASGGAVSYRTTALPNVSLAAGAWYVVCANAANTPNCDLDITPDTDLIQNGAPDALALMFDGLIVDAVSYEGSTPGFTEGSGTGLIDDGATATGSIGRCPDGADTNQNNADFALRPGSPGSTNNCDDVGPSVLATTPFGGSVGVASDASIGITFSEAVNAVGSWFAISCATTGAHGASVSGGPVTFTLDPTLDFASGELCTVTVFSAQVTDVDVLDPPDVMPPPNYTFSFTVADGPVCEQPFVPIYQIQGTGPAAAITGNVTTQGVVVGDFESTTGLSGFYLQDPVGDGNVATSDGIFVFTGSANVVSAGQVVRVSGFARERFNQTALNGTNDNSSPVTAIVDCGAGSVAPTDVTMPFAALDSPERYEGMLVRLPQNLVISEYFNYGRFGEIVLALPLAGETRPFTGTAIDEPGAPANARTLANSLRRITLDDGLGIQNPEFLRHPNGAAFELDNRFRGGDTVQNTIGVIGFDFSLYRIQPTAPAVYTAVNARPSEPGQVGGTLRVAAMNTLNYFLSTDDIQEPTNAPDDPADNICGGNANLECRGADGDQPTELTRQHDKLIEALAGLDADIIGLNELENTPGVDPLGDPVYGIVPGLNAAFGPGTYAAIQTGVIGTDAIRVGLVYRPGVVTPVGPFKLLTSAVDPRFVDTLNRPVLAQTFERVDDGSRFTVAVNHLKSKGSACAGDPDAGDGQGNCNGTRRAAAQALVDWLATDPTGSRDADFLVIGDLNSYAREDPITAIKAGPDDATGTADDYTNLVARDLGTHAYSYVFDGQSGYLDHALSSANLAGQVTGVAEWHINADEPTVLDYDTSFKGPVQEGLYEVDAYRTSDHDPIIVGLDLNAPPIVDAGGPYAVIEGQSVTVTATGSDPDGHPSTLTYAWDLDGDGSFETMGPSAVFSAATLEAPQTRTIQVRVEDADGLSATDTAIVDVIWAFGGFETPVVEGEVNFANAGATVPIKFSLGGDQGLSIFTPGYPASADYECGTTPPPDASQPAAMTNPLRYDAVRDEYVFEWKSSKAWANSCRVFVLGLADGTDRTIAFRFK
jgi:predicted extracellular nuclease